jgi:hypothetical protein
MVINWCAGSPLNMRCCFSVLPSKNLQLMLCYYHVAVLFFFIFYRFVSMSSAINHCCPRAKPPPRLGGATALHLHQIGKSNLICHSCGHPQLVSLTLSHTATDYGPWNVAEDQKRWWETQLAAEEDLRWRSTKLPQPWLMADLDNVVTATVAVLSIWPAKATRARGGGEEVRWAWVGRRSEERYWFLILFYFVLRNNKYLKTERERMGRMIHAVICLLD